MDQTSTNPANPAPSRRLLVFLLPLLLLTLLACDVEKFLDMFLLYPEEASTGSEQVRRSQPAPRPAVQITQVPRTDGRIEYRIKCSTTDPSAENIFLHWSGNLKAQDATASHGATGGNCDQNWVLPVDKNGQAPEVTLVYDPSQIKKDKVVDTFGAQVVGPKAEETVRSVTVKLHESSATQDPARGPDAAWRSDAQPAAITAPQDDYYLWETGMLHHTEGPTMTASLCQELFDLVQSDKAFVATRFPVQPPSLAYTDPYTLPVSFFSDTAPYLALRDEGTLPASETLSTSLDYRLQYLDFAENELPPAPGEHWLALGGVTSPTVDCTGLPDLGGWHVRTHVWLDFGGKQNTCLGCTLPLFYCYQGQAPQALAIRSLDKATFYPDWGITCLGPHFLTLDDGPQDWGLSGQWAAWVTPTQVISFAHHIYNWSKPFGPMTFTLDITSTLDAGWAAYADPQQQTRIVGPISTNTSRLDFWVFGQVPAGAADGSHAVLVSVSTGEALPATRQTSDLVGVGDWLKVAPAGHWVYLPMVLKEP